METNELTDVNVLFRKVFGCIDNTTLNGDDTVAKVKSLCEDSIRMVFDNTRVCAVCVYPVFVKEACAALAGSGIKVASVAGAFPAGQSPIDIKIKEVEYALQEGADEIDMVISRGSFLEGDYDKVRDEVAAIKSSCGDKTLKVILETSELKTLPNIYKAAMLAMEGGADFIKTSTGKSTAQPVEDAPQTMLQAIKDYECKTGRLVGFKAAGGISTIDEMLKYARLAEKMMGMEYITNQKFRIGSSRLAGILYAAIATKI
ncbi:MAG: deoxyribose-phosphate aldolase [Bacteroidales bacterium]|nr:deoxyribose-phosphate aldolase [Bacteroidales bacterium]